jgi:uncharacterized protein (DUF433 family)
MTKALIDRNPGILGGIPVFAGTRVPVKALTDYLEKGETINEFLDDFPSVGRQQVIGFLEEARAAVVARVRPRSRDFKNYLLAMPNVGEDSLFARMPARNHPDYINPASRKL